MPLAQFVDSVMMVPRMMDSGLTNEAARSLYGVFSGLVIRLINMPTALALAIAMSLVPAVSAAQAVHDEEGTRQACDQGLKLAFLIGFPCSIGMSVLAKQVFGFLYLESLAPDHFQTGWELLTVSSLTIVLFTVVQATSGILQGLGKQRIPMYTLIVGVGCKILMNYLLVGIPGVNIHGGPYASIVCYSMSMIPNLYFVCKYARLRFRFVDWVGKPGLAAAVMGAVVWGLRSILPMNRVFTILEVAAGVTVYGITAYLLGAISADTLSSLRRRLPIPGRKKHEPMKNIAVPGESLKDAVSGEPLKDKSVPGESIQNTVFAKQLENKSVSGESMQNSVSAEQLKDISAPGESLQNTVSAEQLKHTIPGASEKKPERNP